MSYGRDWGRERRARVHGRVLPRRPQRLRVDA